MRARLLAHAGRSEQAPRIAALLRLAQSEEEVLIRAAELDTDPWLLNVENGVIDLRSGELRPHDRSYYCTKMAAVTYDPSAKAPKWKRFFEEVIPDEGSRDFLQEVVGYSLTGSCVEHVLFLLHGPGANGKSIFVGTVQRLMGDYGQQATDELLLARPGGGGATNDVARLIGKRFVAVSETESGRRLNEARVKSLTGGDAVAARMLYKEHVEFVPVAKLWLSTNHLPKVSGTDNGIWRRIRKIPFTVTIPSNRQDKQLLGKLAAEASGILNWALEGLARYRAQGAFTESDQVLGATEEYRAEQDTFGQFLDDCTVADTDSSVAASEFYDRFHEWSVEQGYNRPWNRQQIGKIMADRGFGKMTSGKRKVVHYRGLGLTEEDSGGPRVKAKVTG